MEGLLRNDAILLGRVTYQMMEEAWRWPAPEVRPDWMPDWMEPFGRVMEATKKYVVSSTLERVDWNSELVRRDLGEAVRELAHFRWNLEGYSVDESGGQGIKRQPTGMGGFSTRREANVLR